MTEWISSIFLILGSLLILISAIGIIRLPDIYMRMSSTTKAATLGVGLVLIGTAVHFWEIGIVSRAIVIVLFLYLTAPIAAQMIGRASYFNKTPLWKGTIRDDLGAMSDQNDHELKNNEKSNTDSEKE